MAQTIKIKRGGVDNIASLTLSTGEIALATGSLAAGIAANPFIIAGNSGNTLPVGAILTGSSTPLVNAKLNGALFYNNQDKQLIRLDSAGNQNLDIAATVENPLTIGAGLFGTSFDGSAGVTISVDSGSIAINDLNTSTDLSVANGGTGTSTLTDHGVLVGSGTDAITALAVGNDGQLLVGQSNNDPSFQTVTGVININNAGATAFTSTANSLISGAFTATSASIATNISTNAGNISTNAGNISANASNISTNASNIATLTAETSSYALATDLLGLVSASSGANNQIAYFDNGSYRIQGSSNLTFDDDNLTIGTTGQVRFRDTGLYLYSSADGQLDAIADTKLNLQAPGVDIGNISTTAATTVNIGNSDNSATVNIKGNLNVEGSTTTINSTTVNIDDNIIVVNYGPGPLATAGIQAIDGTGTSTLTGSLIWNGNDNKDWWEAGTAGNEKRVILEGASAGTADTVVKFDAAGTVVNSTITDNGSDISLGGNVTITSGHTLTAPNAVTFSGLTGATNNTSAQVAFVGSDGKLGEVSTTVDSSATATGFLAYSSDNVLEFVSTIDGGTF